MIKKSLTIAALALTGHLFAQQQMCFTNPSMEGTSQAHVVPAPWIACFGSPDTQPGQWGFTQPASNGNTYVSFLHSGNSPNGYSEGMSQQLTPSMTANTQYSFQVDLAHSNVYNTASPGTCYSSLAVWGGNSQCAKTQLLWSSGSFMHTNWQTYTVTFTPTANWSYITFVPYYITTCSGYINCMMDNLTCVVPSSVVSGTNLACYNVCTGTATATPTGGTPPYTYLWTPGNYTTQTITGLCAGTYSCVITDNNGITTSGSYIVTQPAQLTASSSSTNILCNGQCTGTASVTGSGGTGTITYLWSPGNQTTSSVNNLCAGTYTCTVSDGNSCTTQQVVTITQPPVVTANASVTNVSCNGGNDGTATVTPGGGTGTYTYNWSPSGGTNATASNLSAGGYTVTVTDGNGCTAQAVVMITAPPAVTASASGTNVSCNGGNNGSATVTAGGGTGTYTYNWAPSGGTNSTANNLTANTYTVTVTDGNGCTATTTVVVTEPTVLSIQSSGFSATCNGSCDGQAVTIPAGGTQPYSFAWSPSGGNGPSENNLCVGTYTVLVTDANGCSITDTAIVTEPTVLAMTTASTQATCGQFNGSASVNASGGVGPYTYNWAPSGGTNATATGLASGTYTCTLTDFNGCTLTATVIVPNAAGITAGVTTSTNVTCNGACDGTVTANTNGGTAPFTYLWSNATTNLNLSNACAGSYTLTVTDANGCTATTTVAITEPPLLTAVASNGSTICSGANANASVTAGGGTPGYTYLWSNAANTSAISVNPTTTTTYTVVVTDQNGCTASATVTITVNALPVVTFTPSSLDGCVPVCTNFSSPTQGQTFDWDFGDGNQGSGANVTHCYTTPGTYSVTLIVTNNGCIGTLTIPNMVNAYPIPTANFSMTPASSTISSPVVTVTNNCGGCDSSTFNFGENTSTTMVLPNGTASYTYADTGTFTITQIVWNQFGCYDTLQYTWVLRPEYSIYLPNAFTPNGDGLNEVFVPVGFYLDPDHFEFYVFDRWGQMIFRTDRINVGWDGRANGGKDIAQEDVYVWKIITTNTTTGKKEQYVGHVTLIK